MTTSFIKPRPLGTRSFAEQANRAKQAAARGAGSFKKIEGQFSSFYPRKDKALWIAICPEQSWNFDLYNRETGEVETKTDQLFFAYTSHRVVSNGRSFQCSAGAHKDKPCWGCGIRNRFYDNKRAKEEKSGVKIEGEPAINAMTQYALAVVQLENIAKVPVLNPDGSIRKTKGNEDIYRETPTPLLAPEESKRLRAEGSTKFAMASHYSLGITHLNALTAFDEELKNHCKNCAEELTAHHVYCPECGTTRVLTDEEDVPVLLKGQTMSEARNTVLECSCGFKGPMNISIECACGKPEEGKLLDFAIRLVSRKVGETQSVLELAGVRTIKYYTDKHPHVAELLGKPLALDEIFAATPLGGQQYMVPEILREGVSPAPKPKAGAKGPSEPYPLTDDEDENAA